MIPIIKRLSSNPWPLVLAASILCVFTLPKMQVTPTKKNAVGWVSITPSGNHTPFETRSLIDVLDNYLSQDKLVDSVFWQVDAARLNGHVAFNTSEPDAAHTLLSTLPTVINNIGTNTKAMVDWSLNPQHEGSLSITLRHPNNEPRLKQITNQLTHKWRSLPGVSSVKTTQSNLTRWMPARVETGGNKAPLSIDQHLFLMPHTRSQARLIDTIVEPTQTLLVDIAPTHHQHILSQINNDLQSLRLIDEDIAFAYTSIGTDPTSHWLFVLTGLLVLFWIAAGFRNAFALFFIQLCTLCQACWLWSYQTDLSLYIFYIWLTSFYIPIAAWYRLKHVRQSPDKFLENLVNAVKHALPLQGMITVTLTIACGLISFELTLLPLLSLANSLLLIPVMAGALYRVSGTVLPPPPGFFKPPARSRVRKAMTVSLSMMFVYILHSQYTPTTAHRFVFRAPAALSHHSLAEITKALRTVGEQSHNATDVITWINSYYSPSQHGFYHRVASHNIVGLEVHLPWYASTGPLLASISKQLRADLLELSPVQRCARFPFCSTWLPLHDQLSSTKTADNIQLIELPPSYIDGISWSKSLNMVTASDADRNVLVDALTAIDFSALESNWPLIKQQPLLSSDHFTLADAFEWEHWIPVPESRFYFKGQPLLEVNMLHSRFDYNPTLFKSLNQLTQNPLPIELNYYAIVALIVIVLLAWSIRAHQTKAMTVGWLVALLTLLDSEMISANEPAWIFFTWVVSLTINANAKTPNTVRSATLTWTFMSFIALLSISTTWIPDALLILLMIPAIWSIQIRHCQTIRHTANQLTLSQTAYPIPIKSK